MSIYRPREWVRVLSDGRAALSMALTLFELSARSECVEPLIRLPALGIRPSFTPACFADSVPVIVIVISVARLFIVRRRWPGESRRIVPRSAPATDCATLYWKREGT